MNIHKMYLIDTNEPVLCSITASEDIECELNIDRTTGYVKFSAENYLIDFFSTSIEDYNAETLTIYDNNTYYVFSQERTSSKLF